VIGRLLRLFPESKLTEDTLRVFKLVDLKAMAKGLDIPQVGSKDQIISSLVVEARNLGLVKQESQSSAASKITKTPQPPKRKRTDVEDKAPQTESKAKRARRGSLNATKQ